MKNELENLKKQIEHLESENVTLLLNTSHYKKEIKVLMNENKKLKARSKNKPAKDLNPLESSIYSIAVLFDLMVNMYPKDHYCRKFNQVKLNDFKKLLEISPVPNEYDDNRFYLNLLNAIVNKGYAKITHEMSGSYLSFNGSAAKNIKISPIIQIYKEYFKSE